MEAFIRLIFLSLFSREFNMRKEEVEKMLIDMVLRVEPKAPLKRN
jgi:hypothetical protein